MNASNARKNGSPAVLVVEDNPDDTRLLQVAAQEACPDVGFHFVPNGREALCYLDAQGRFADQQTYPFPKLVLLDMRLPGGLDGFQVLERIRCLSQRDGLMVLAWSDGLEPGLAAQVKAAGADHFIPKPLSFSHLMEEVARICVLARGNGD